MSIKPQKLFLLKVIFPFKIYFWSPEIEKAIFRHDYGYDTPVDTSIAQHYSLL